MRFDEFRSVEEKFKDQQVKEILPALAAVGRAAGSAVGAVAKGATQLAKKGAGMAAQAAKQVGATAVKTPSSTGKTTSAQIAAKTQQAVAQQLLKRGNSIPMPTQKGTKDFKIDDVKGDEVTLINPDARKAPEEPEKLTYKKKDLDTVIQNLAQGQEQ